MATEPEPRALMRQLVEGQLSRRAFITRAAALGFSASAIAAFLAACGGSAATNTPAAVATTAPAATTAAATTAPTAAGAAATTAPTAAATKAATAATGGAASPAASPSAAASASPAAGTAKVIGAATTHALGAAGGWGPGPTKRGAGGTLKVLYWQAPTILNPHLSQGTKDSDAARLVIEPLFDFGPDDTIVPWLITEVPSVDNGGVAKDGMSVTYKLKQGVTWSDGQPFSADDVVFTWQYVTNKDTGAGTVGNYVSVDKVEAVDPNTVKVSFKAPTPGWYLPFSDGILPQHYFKDGIGTAAKNFPGNLKPIGTGPFVVDSFSPGDSIAYSANPKFRDPNSPAFDKVQWKGGGDATSAARAVFQTGDYNIAWNLQIEPSILNQLSQGSGGKAELGFQSGQGVEQIQLNESDPNKEVDGQRSHFGTPHPYLADVKVRQALNFLGDRQTVATQLYGPAAAPSSVLLNAPESVLPKPADVPWEFSVDKANAALDALGWAKGPDGVRAKGGVKMTAVYSTTVNSVRQKEQQIVKDAMGKAGVSVELKSVDAGVFFSSDAGNPDTAAHFYTDMEMFTNSAGSPDIQSWIELWTTDQINQKANNWSFGNNARYSNPAYDAIAKQAAGELDPAKRGQLFTKALQTLYDDAVCIPLVGRKLVFAATAGIAGFNGGPWNGLMWNLANWTKK
ncbi:MAG TPA: peptide ABC transporter substrate-binding protein [Thermomicrobiales bacterium]|nr:peptide ABC transporter substrate-binding protein [Thermomicrobiales bacterium]